MQPLTANDPHSIGPHRLLARLGAGGMGRVYLARTPDDHLCALKVVKEELAHDSQFRARFAREIRTAQRVRGPFTPSVVDADPDTEVPWMATEYIPGPTLKEAVLQAGVFPEPSLRVLALGLARALETIHAAGLMHRDLKPGNILLSPRGPQVIDFGIARAVEGTVLTRTGQTFGTPSYSSPEQIVGHDITLSSDLFSLAGAVIFAASGEPPFGPGPAVVSIQRIMSEQPNLGAIPEGPLRDLMARCCAKDPGHRPDATTLHRSLSALPLPSAEHGWLPSPVTQQIDLRAGEADRVEQAERTTVPLAQGNDSAARVPGPEDLTARSGPGGEERSARGRGRLPLLVGAAAAALVLAGGGALAWYALPFGAEEDPEAAASPSGEGPDEETREEAGEETDGLGIDLSEEILLGLDFAGEGEELYLYGSLTLSAWDLEEGGPTHLFEPVPGYADIGDDGTVAGTYAGHIQVWDGPTGEETVRLGQDSDVGYYTLPSVSPDGTTVTVVAASTVEGSDQEEYSLQFWDLASESLRTETPLESSFFHTDHTPDGSLLVTTRWDIDESFDRPVGVWDTRTGELIHELEAPDQGALKFAVSPDSATVVVAAGSKATLYDLATGEALTELSLSEGSGGVDDVAYSADGTLVYAAGLGGGTYRGSVWDVETGELVRDNDVMLHEYVAVHPDGETLVTVSGDGTGLVVLDSDFSTVDELN